MKITPENHFEVGEATITISDRPLTIEYKVRPVTRYIVTRYENRPSGGGVEEVGAGAEYGSYHSAFEIAYATALFEKQKSNSREAT